MKGAEEAGRGTAESVATKRRASPRGRRRGGAPSGGRAMRRRGARGGGGGAGAAGRGGGARKATRGRLRDSATTKATAGRGGRRAGGCVRGLRSRRCDGRAGGARERGGETRARSQPTRRRKGANSQPRLRCVARLGGPFSLGCEVSAAFARATASQRKRQIKYVGCKKKTRRGKHGQTLCR